MVARTCSVKCPQPDGAWAVRLCAVTAALALGCGSDAVRDLTPVNPAEPALPAAPAVLDGCSELGATDPWWNQTISDQSGVFHAEFDAIPSAGAIDAVVGLGNGNASDFSQLAAIVRFNTAGTIDARSGSTYRADVVRPYQAGARYHFRLDVNTFAHVYSVWLRNSAGSYDAIARGYPFRSEQAGVNVLDNAASKVDSTDGRLEVCGLFAIADSTTADNCLIATAGDGFVSVPLPDATALDTVTFTATPSAQNIDGVIGLSAGPVDSFSDLAAAVRFAPSGAIDVRDGDRYRVDVLDGPYQVRALDIRMIADLTSRTYSVFRGPWQDGRELARQYQFRSQQRGATHLDHLALVVDGTQGSVSVCRPQGAPSTGVAYSKEGSYQVVPLLDGQAVISNGTDAAWLDAQGQAIAAIGRSGPLASDGAGNVLSSRVDGTLLFVEKLGPGFAPIWSATTPAAAESAAGPISAEPGGGVAAATLLSAERLVTLTRFTASGECLSQLTVPGDRVVIDGGEPIVTLNDGSMLQVTRYAVTGEVVWTRTFTGQLGISAMIVDPHHNLVFGGELFTAMDFGGGTLPLRQTDDGKLNAFVVQLSPTGAHVFSLKTGYTHIGGIASDGARVLVSGTQQTQFHYWHLQAFDSTGAATAGPTFNTGFGENGFGGRIAIGPSGRVWWNLETQWPLFPKWPYLVVLDD
jgi:hypothetical protein